MSLLALAFLSNWFVVFETPRYVTADVGGVVGIISCFYLPLGCFVLDVKLTPNSGLAIFNALSAQRELLVLAWSTRQSAASYVYFFVGTFCPYNILLTTVIGSQALVFGDVGVLSLLPLESSRNLLMLKLKDFVIRMVWIIWMIWIIWPLYIDKTRWLRRNPKVLPWNKRRSISIKIIEVLVILKHIFIGIGKSLMTKNSTSTVDYTLTSEFILIARLRYHLEMLLRLLLLTIGIGINNLLSILLNQWIVAVVLCDVVHTLLLRRLRLCHVLLLWYSAADYRLVFARNHVLLLLVLGKRLQQSWCKLVWSLVAFEFVFVVGLLILI